MNLWNTLTYNVLEHNIVYINDAIIGRNPTSFWHSIWRRIRRAWKMNVLSYMLRQNRHPFYNQCAQLKCVVFIPLTNNNRRALEPIWTHLDEGTYTIIPPSQREYIPVQLVYFYSLVYIWPLLRGYLKANQQERLIIRSNFDEFFETIGYVKVIEQLLKHNNVKLIAVANDHCSMPRAFVKVAKEYGIKSLYVQHCSVTETFPALPFDYSFLDGEESYLKYKSAGTSQGTIYIAGNPRFDVCVRYRKSNKSQTGRIGIALNMMDKESKIKELCEQLLSLGYEITIRPHPGESFEPQWYLERGIEYSNSNIENPFEFISRMNLVIAGECGIHLDAAMLNVRSICYNMLDENYKIVDWYSYVKNGLTPYASNLEALIFLLPDVNDGNIWQKVRWYNAAYGTNHEGHIGEMLADFIRYEQVGDIDGFDKKYGFVEKVIDETIVKVYGD